VWTWLGRCGLEHGKAYKDEVIEGGKYEVVKEALRKPPLKFSINLGQDFVQMTAKVSSGFMASGIQAILHSEI
jgi:hypothetical protein